MKSFLDTLLTIGVLGGILIVSFFITNAYAKAMYNKCSQCGILNAKRRTHCRQCATEIPRRA